MKTKNVVINKKIKFQTSTLANQIQQNDFM